MICYLTSGKEFNLGPNRLMYLKQICYICLLFGIVPPGLYANGTAAYEPAHIDVPHVRNERHFGGKNRIRLCY